MKKVFTKSADVIKLFSRRSQDSARCSNVYFNNKNKIYSYGSHYLLGEFIDDSIIMIDDRGYSRTTAKHISQITYATDRYEQFFKSETDLGTVYNTILKLNDKLKKARKPELYTTPILHLWKEFNIWVEYVELNSLTIFPTIFPDVEALEMYGVIKNIVDKIISPEAEDKDVEEIVRCEMEELQELMKH